MSHVGGIDIETIKLSPAAYSNQAAMPVSERTMAPVLGRCRRDRAAALLRLREAALVPNHTHAERCVACSPRLKPPHPVRNEQSMTCPPEISHRPHPGSLDNMQCSGVHVPLPNCNSSALQPTRESACTPQHDIGSRN